MRYFIILLVIIIVFLGIRHTTRTIKKSKNFVDVIKKEINIDLGKEGCGNVVEKNVSIEPFDKLKVSRNIKVFLNQGDDAPKLLVITDKNLHDNIEIKSMNNTLELSLKENVKHSKKNEIHVTYKNLNLLKVFAGGNVKSAEQNHEFSKIHIDVSSGANVKLQNIEADDLECDITTGAYLYLSGKANDLQIKASTGANANLKELLVEKCKAKATTGSNIKIHVLNNLDANAATAGNIKYKGNPLNINKNISSGGNINSID